MKQYLAMITILSDGGTPEVPVDPGYSPPWARPGAPRPPGGPVDPGYSPPWATPRPPGGPVDPGYSPPWAQAPGGGGPVDPGYFPPGIGLPPDLVGGPPRPDHSLPLFPFHPIILPPDTEVPPVPERERKFGYIWLPETGWTLVSLVPIPSPS